MSFKKLFSSVFQDKTVFVTGHTGFQGLWLTTWLMMLGAKVIGFSRDPPKDSEFYKIQGSQKLVQIQGDITDFHSLNQSIIKHKPEILFHLAAQPIVRLSYEKPVETFETNVLGTVNVLECFRKIPNSQVCAIMSSDKCYKNREDGRRYVESDQLGGHDPYSTSKCILEFITSSYRSSFFNQENEVGYKKDVATIRAGNMIGGGDWAEDRIIPDCVSSLFNQKEISVRNPNSIRPWQYVLEPVSGMLLLISKMLKEPSLFSEAWNFGPNESQNEISVKKLVELVIKEWGNGSWKITNGGGKEKKHESNILVLDSTKANKKLGWNPIYSLKEAIAETISWYKEYEGNKLKRSEITSSKIQNYVKKAKQSNLQWANS